MPARLFHIPPCSLLLPLTNTTAALNLDPEYIKPLNRRVNAFDDLGKPARPCWT